MPRRVASGNGSGSQELHVAQKPQHLRRHAGSSFSHDFLKIDSRGEIQLFCPQLRLRGT
jgi:hypothetical protein